MINVNFLKSFFLSVVMLTILGTQANTQEREWANDWGDSWEQTAPTKWPIFGFVEAASGSFIGGKAKNEPLNELRWRLEWSNQFGSAKVSTKADLLYDDIVKSSSRFTARLRDANVEFSPFASVDAKVGRQTLTWGTGDLLFINDLFPKDWQSFLSGRDDEYLKAPSDAIKLSWFTNFVNADVVITPQFEADHYLNGERFSFFTINQTIEQPAELVTAIEPKDGESALRLFKTIEGVELAAYGYRGYYKSPNTVDEFGQSRFSKLEVFGASARGNLFGGLGNLEIGRYNSIDDPLGTNPFIDNDQLRILFGYERELITNLNASVQYYVEMTHDYQALIDNSNDMSKERERIYRLITIRLTHLALQQKLMNSLFLFYSPTEQDSHLRLKTEYRVDDRWTLTAGAYWFDGKTPDTFWSQFRNNRNVWLRLRYSY